jgi:WD40 repeat protein/DNA-binding SARP family transcriptional activator
MDFRILGPLEVHGDLGAIDVPGTKRRAVLAVLLLQANEAVSAERIAVALWGEDAPASAAKTVQVHVSRLRKALGDESLLETTPAGYRLNVGPGELDAERFEQLAEKGRAALAAGRPEEAGSVLRKALAMWRGPPLADLAFEPFAQVEIARLEEQQQAAIETRIEADLAAGRHAELVAELRRMVAKHPARERLAGHLMLALYRCGRQSEALEAYHGARQRLAAEAGLEPGDELRALQDAILHHDPALAMASAEALPHELDVTSAPPLLGRRSELAWLRDRWDEARAGTGRVVVLAGDEGMGKTRLVAELAADAHAHGATVLYASGDGPARAVHEVLGRAAGAHRPLLLVVDDADEAGEEVLAAVRDASGGSTLVVAIAKAPEALETLEAGGLLHVKRLGSSAVGEIAALYAPDSASQDVPTEWLLGASDGVPRRVHDVASLWARRETARRIGAVAGRTAEGRSQLRSMEDELAGGVVQLQGTHEWREDGGNGKQHVVCPFKGLAVFEAADAPYFFGRERLVAELVARLVGAPVLGVVGPSGSGKSSAVRAGLLPALASGVLPGSQDWPQRVIRPGEHPMRQLDRALDGIEGDSFVLAVDQFEEVFTACRDASERVAFLAELVGVAGDEAGGAVVLVVRADFYGRCASYPALSRVLASNHVLVGPMGNDELQRAIVCPAQRVGLTVEDELVDAIVDDVEEAPGALPLLSTALLELWQHRDGRRLQLVSYERTGGVRGAVARLAEDAFDDLDERRQSLARQMLLQLVEVDEEGTVERHRRRLAELGTDEDVEGLLEVLADRRLVTVSEGTVELAHEALLREWPRLRGWIDDDREGLRIERSLRTGAREWLRVGKDDGALYRGTRLAEASDWTSRNGHRLPDLERDFVRASVAREGHDRRTRRRRLTFAFASLTLGLILIAFVAAVAINERQDAEDQRDVATSRELGLQSAGVVGANPELATRLALEALESATTDEAALALRQAAAAFPQRGVLRAGPRNAWAAAFSPDGTRIVTGSDEGARLWDAKSRRETERLRTAHGAVHSAAYSRGGDRIALGFEDGSVAVTDGSLRSPRELLAAGRPVRAVGVSDDGTRVVAAVDGGAVELAIDDGAASPRTSSWDVGKVRSAAISPDGKRVASAGDDGTVRLWDASGGGSRILHGEGNRMWDVAFSPDGRRLVAAGDEGTVFTWDVQSGREVASRPLGLGPLFTVTVSADSRRIAAGGERGIVRVWAAAGGQALATLKGGGSFVYDVRFGSTGDQVVSAGQDGLARLWDAGQTQLWKVPGTAYGIYFNHDGRLAATGGDALRVWNVADGRLVNSLKPPSESTAIAFSPVADALVIADAESQEVLTWPIHQDRATLLFRAPGSSGVNTARLDAGGRRVAYADGAGRLAVRTLSSGDEVTLGGAPKDIYDAQFSADGERVATMSLGGEGDIWRLGHPDRPERRLLGHRGAINELEYAADGRVATAGEDGTVRVWPARAGREIVAAGHTGGATDVSFSTDGSKLLTGGFDHTLRLWDSRTGDQLAVLGTWPSSIYSMGVAPGGKVAVLDGDNFMQVFRCDACGSFEQIEKLARSRQPRQLTAAERRRYLGEDG